MHTAHTAAGPYVRGDSKLMTEINTSKLGAQSDRAARLLNAMSNQKRLMIMCHLLESEKSVGEIADLVDLHQSPLSQHLAKLRSLDLVKTRRDGQSIFYSLSSPEVEAVLSTLYVLYCSPEMSFRQQA
jgi:DNA-binding transcriptional ArsR family regulator